MLKPKGICVYSFGDVARSLYYAKTDFGPSKLGVVQSNDFVCLYINFPSFMFINYVFGDACPEHHGVINLWWRKTVYCEENFLIVDQEIWLTITWLEKRNLKLWYLHILQINQSLFKITFKTFTPLWSRQCLKKQQFVHFFSKVV